MHLNSNKPVLVEFLGLPGSGKTTLVNAIQPVLSSQGLRVATKVDLHNWKRDQHRLINLNLLFKRPLRTFKHLFNIWMFLCSLDSFKNVGFKRALTGVLINLQLDAFISDRDFDVILMDQGALQNLWSITAFSSKFSKKSLQTCVNDGTDLKYLDTLYVNVTTTPELSATRLEERNLSDGRFDLLDNNHRYAAIKKSHEVMTVLLDMANNVNKSALTVDASEPVQNKASIIVSKINEVVKLNKDDASVTF